MRITRQEAKLRKEEYEIQTTRKFWTAGFGNGSWNNDLWRRLGLGCRKGRSAKGVRRLPRGRWQFHRHRKRVHERDERIVPRRIYAGPPQEYEAGSGCESQAARNRLYRSLLGSYLGSDHTGRRDHARTG